MKLITWNIQRGRGADGRVDLDRIVGHVQRFSDFDVLCVQEKRATQLLDRRHEKLIKSGKRLAHGTPEERHQVRIAAKKARYATEFFQSLHQAGRVKRYVRRLAALQDALGW